MTTVIVTGGAGYVGSHTCKALAQAGYTPVTYDSLEFGHEWAVRWGPLERGRIEDRDRLRAVFAAHRPAAVLHFAAYIEVGESVADPGRYWRNNVGGTLCLLEEMRTAGISAFVMSSSCAVYGAPEHTPITEIHRLAPVSPYGMTKLTAERMLADFDAAHGLRSMALRYFNAVGADPDGDTGEAHDPESHLIPLVLDAASGRRPTITIFGNDYDTHDGTCIRDYTHVCDLADAHVRAVARLLDGAASDALNLGTGRGHSVREVIDTARMVTGRPIAAVAGPRRPGDPPALVADASRAQTILDWTPRHSDLASQISDAWAWHRKLHGLTN